MTFQCDAVTGLQTKREDGRPMLTLKGMMENPPAEGSTQVPRDWFQRTGAGSRHHALWLHSD
jgi:hypothetical protein